MTAPTRRARQQMQTRLARAHMARPRPTDRQPVVLKQVEGGGWVVLDPWDVTPIFSSIGRAFAFARREGWATRQIRVSPRGLLTPYLDRLLHRHATVKIVNYLESLSC